MQPLNTRFLFNLKRQFIIGRRSWRDKVVVLPWNYYATKMSVVLHGNPALLAPDWFKLWLIREKNKCDSVILIKGPAVPHDKLPQSQNITEVSCRQTHRLMFNRQIRYGFTSNHSPCSCAGAMRLRSVRVASFTVWEQAMGRFKETKK